MRFSRLCYGLFIASISGFSPYFLKTSNSVPKEFEVLVQTQESLPRYAEAFYSPLGRSPAVDAILGDPYYFPVYAETVSEKLKQASQSRSLFEVCTASFMAGGVPLAGNVLHLQNDCPIPEVFLQNFDPLSANLLYQLWQAFIQVYKESENVLSVLSQEEKEWIRQNYEAFFFGKQEHEDYDFFTSESPMPLKFFEMAARIDLAKLSECACKLACLVDIIYRYQNHLSPLSLHEDFQWEEQGIKLHISTKDYTSFNQDADFFLCFGGHNTFTNNAGGTLGQRPAALHISLKGHNQFIGSHFVQGSGCLGVGALVNFEGDNYFQAKSYSQGVGFFGSGVLANYEGHNQYDVDFFGQSCAAFGSSLLWDQQGDCRYYAREGMAQAASSTLGVAFLINNGSDNSYIAGTPGQAGKRAGGIGQGGSTGVRFYPWMGNPSFYGGISFLYSTGCRNQYKNGWLGQGSAYFLGAGILVDEGGNAAYSAEMDSQGQGLHLSAGLLLQKGSDNHFEGGWGSLGVSADRSVGFAINTGGNNVYNGTVQNQGTARKPKSLGVLINLQGNNSYSFQGISNGNIQFPSNPLEWPGALFMTFGPNNTYSQVDDNMKRGSGSSWGVYRHSYGFDRLTEVSFEQLLEKLPPKPHIPFDPINGWRSNVAYKPLTIVNNPDDLSDLIEEIPNSNYDRRRHLYESLDLFRFTHPKAKIDLSPLLSDPAKAPEDQFNYAAMWGTYTPQVLEAVNEGLITSDYARQMGIKLIGTLAPPNESIPVLAKVLKEDPSQSNRAYAAYFLARISTPESLAQLSFEGTSELVRYLGAKGLRNSPMKEEALHLVAPLFNDPSFYVRRSAAMTAISLQDKAGIPVLLDTLQYNTLDTTENYGDNLFEELAKYVHVNFGLDKAAWINWWKENEDSFEFTHEAKNRIGLD